MQPTLTSPEVALSILSQAAAAAYSRGAITFQDLEAALVATKVLAEALKPADKPVSPDSASNPNFMEP